MSWKESMENTNWLKQAKDQPLFPDLLWSRPENKRHAGKLLIVGGNSASFAAVSSAYSAAAKAGIGSTRVMLPGSLERMLAKVFAEAEFTPATPSGSFARTSLGPLTDAAAWADGVLLAGDFGRNSETAILLESFLQEYRGGLTLAGDSLDYFTSASTQLVNRPQTTLVVSVAQLQKLALPGTIIKQQDDLVKIINSLSSFSGRVKAEVVTHHANQIIVAAAGKVSTTPAETPDLTQLAAYASVWRLQQPAQTFEALTCAVYCLTA